MSAQDGPTDGSSSPVDAGRRSIDTDDDSLLIIIRASLMVTVAVAFGVAPRLGMQKGAYAYGLVVSLVVLVLTIRGYRSDRSHDSRHAEKANGAAVAASSAAAAAESAGPDVTTSIREVIVKLVKESPSDQLGLDIVGFERRGLKIQTIKAGLAETWNAAHPETQVKIGDCIVAVNGVRGHPDDLFEQLWQCSSLELVIEQTYTQKASPGFLRDFVAAGGDPSNRPAAEKFLRELAAAAAASAGARPGTEQAEDPLWSSDWTNVAEAMKRQPPVEAQPVEVFEMSDKSTWLAGMEKRRDQAKRAGKEKLAQKISKEIAEALRSQQVGHVQSSSAAAARQGERSAAAQRKAPVEEDSIDAMESVYNMDWSRLGPESCDQALPTAAVA